MSIVKPVIYGNMSRYFGKKREEDGHTHHWTLYVKPFHNEDMSGYLKKVHFKLHESYAKPNRVVTSPPYEVSETGWGEFEATIKLYFEDSGDKPVTIYHALKLFQNDPLIMTGQKSLVSEFYDEIAFQEPSPHLYNLLMTAKPLTQSPYKHETNFEEKKGTTLQAISDARTTVRNEIYEVKECLKEAKDIIQVLKSELAKHEDPSETT